MEPTEPIEADVDFWERRDGRRCEAVLIGGPEEGDGVIPCPALVDRAGNMVHVGYKANEIDLAHLAQGGTLWFTTWGMIPVHRIEVVGPDRIDLPDDWEG